MGVFLPAALSPVDLLAYSPTSSKGPAQGSPLPALIAVVVESAVGWFLAHKGIVDDRAKKTLNKINTSLFTPCLLFNKVAFSLSPDKLADLYIIPIGFCIISAFSASVAYLFSRLVGLKRGQRNFAIACATFQNSNSLPIALLQSLIGEKLPLSWGPHDSRDGMLGRGLSYLVLFSSLGIIVRWSVGVRLLTSAEGQDDDGDEAPPADVERAEAHSPGQDSAAAPAAYEIREDEADAAGEGDALLRPEDAANTAGTVSSKSSRSILKNGASSAGSTPARTRESTLSAGSSSENTVVANGAPVAEPQLVVLPSTNFAGRADPAALEVVQTQRKKRARMFRSFPTTPTASVYSASEPDAGSSASDDWDHTTTDDEGEDAEWGAERGFGRRWLDGGRMVRVRRAARRAGHKVKRFWAKFSDFMTVPLWAAVLSLVVACIPPLQSTLNKAEPLKAAIRSAGSCSVPITLVTLGAYFYRPSTAAAADTSPLRPAEREAPPSQRKPLRSFSTAVLRRLRNPWAPLPPSSAASLARGSGTGSGRGETRTVVVAVMTRMVIVPLVLIPLFAYYAKVTVNVADDPVFVVVACLLIGSPAAITLSQIASTAASPVFERLISRTLLVSYALLTAPSTVLLVLAALWIDGLQHPQRANGGEVGGLVMQLVGGGGNATVV
ncbi:hypothetical protein JCM10450v2_004027 [Rhodotorula kratochvilovae]